MLSGECVYETIRNACVICLWYTKSLYKYLPLWNALYFDQTCQTHSSYPTRYDEYE